MPFLEVVSDSINPQVVRLLPEELARKCLAVPVRITGRALQLAMVAPDDMDLICEAELITGYQVEPVVALQNAIESALDRGFDERVVARQTIVDMKMSDLDAAEQMIDEELESDVEEEEDRAPVVRLAAPS